jgi:hypothetical protein
MYWEETPVYEDCFNILPKGDKRFCVKNFIQRCLFVQSKKWAGSAGDVIVDRLCDVFQRNSVIEILPKTVQLGSTKRGKSD